MILSGTSFQDVLDSCGMLLKNFLFKMNEKSTEDTKSLDTNEKFSRVQSTDESFVTSSDLSYNTVINSTESGNVEEKFSSEKISIPMTKNDHCNENAMNLFQKTTVELTDLVSG